MYFKTTYLSQKLTVMMVVVMVSMALAACQPVQALPVTTDAALASTIEAANNPETEVSYCAPRSRSACEQ